MPLTGDRGRIAETRVGIGWSEAMVRMCMVAGQFPTMTWSRNRDGVRRTPAEAREIAIRWGVVIPNDVDFIVDQLGELSDVDTARSAPVTKRPGGKVVWSDLMDPRFGKVRLRVWEGAFDSDEAIVAIFAHEMHELANLKPLMDEGVLTIEDFIDHCRPGLANNLHDQAWDVADGFVRKMREETTR